MDTTNKKPTVLNPLLLRNTVGAELADIFEANGIESYNNLLGVSDLRKKEKLSKALLNKVKTILPEFDVVSDYLCRFQEHYLNDKIKYTENYKQSLKNYRLLKGAIPFMKGEFTDGFDVLDDILDFFGADNEEEVFKASECQAALFRKHNNVSVNPINLYIWLRRGELDFDSMKLPEYDAEALNKWIREKSWLEHIEDPEYFKELPKVFSQFGVALALVPFLKNTVYGAVRWKNNHPLIEISDRNRDLATCWFTLFHELGHVLLHQNIEIYEGNINSANASERMERQANKFANTYLFNGDELRKAVFNRKNSAIRMTANGLAEEFNVAPIFAAYWLIKAQYHPTLQPHISISFIDQYQ